MQVVHFYSVETLNKNSVRKVEDIDHFHILTLYF